jgi:hypothetical protein
MVQVLAIPVALETLQALHQVKVVMAEQMAEVLLVLLMVLVAAVAQVQ